MTTSQNRLRVAYVVHTFEMAGLERCIARLVNHLDDSRFSPIIVCLERNSDAAAWLTRDDVPIVELHKRPGNDPLAIRRLAGALRKHEVDIVHSHNWGTLLETVLARRWARVPVHVHAEHGLAFGDQAISGWRRRLRRQVARWALRRVDAVVAVAEQVQRRLASRFGYPAENVHVIGNGVDPLPNGGEQVQRGRIRKELGIPASALVVGSVGRLVSVKDFGTAIDAVARLVRQDIDVHLLLVGDGPQRNSLAAEAEAAEIASRVHFAGRQADVAPFLAAMDVYVNSSLSEGMNLSILEAMAAGLPLVVSEVGQNASLLGGEGTGGLVVAPQSPDRLAGAVQELLNNADMRRQFGRRARGEFQRHYSTQRMVDQYQTLYSSLSSGRQKPAWSASIRKAEI